MVSTRRGISVAGAALAVLVLAALLVPAGVSARSDSPPTAVGVGAREFRFGIYRTSVPRGLVRFNVTNYGEDGHDLVVLDRSGRELGRSAEIRAGQRATVQVRLTPGTYQLHCDLADHARRGMTTSIRVTRPARR
jgi:hypothetical protein